MREPDRLTYGTTVTVAVTSGMNGGALARMIVVPGLTPVTRNTELEKELPSGYSLMVAGTVATFGLDEVNCTMTPAPGPQGSPGGPQGADSERTMVSFSCVPRRTESEGGEKVNVAGTATTWVAVT